MCAMNVEDRSKLVAYGIAWRVLIVFSLATRKANARVMRPLCYRREASKAQRMPRLQTLYAVLFMPVAIT